MGSAWVSLWFSLGRNWVQPALVCGSAWVRVCGSAWVSYWFSVGRVKVWVQPGLVCGSAWVGLRFGFCLGLFVVQPGLVCGSAWVGFGFSLG